MKIELNIYDPKYRPLDIVYLPNTNNKWGIYLKIIESCIEYGRFEVNNDIMNGPHEQFAGYNCIIMLGSMNESSTYMHGYLSMDLHEVDDNAVYVGVGSKYVLFTLDTYGKVIDDIVSQANDTISITPGVE